MLHRYVHGNGPGADDPLLWYDTWASGWRRALLADHQGSIVQVADRYGNPIATNSYDPWGIPGATPAGRFGYTGQTWVPESRAVVLQGKVLLADDRAVPAGGPHRV